METNDIREMLDRVTGVQDACDLDLLLFFHRHPRALLTSERIVAYVGYDHDRVARSLDGLLAAGLIERAQNTTRSARLYLLISGAPKEPLHSLLRLASTRRGRLAVRAVLAANRPGDVSASGSRRPDLRAVN